MTNPDTTVPVYSGDIHRVFPEIPPSRILRRSNKHSKLPRLE